MSTSSSLSWTIGGSRIGTPNDRSHCWGKKHRNGFARSAAVRCTSRTGTAGAVGTMPRGVGDGAWDRRESGARDAVLRAEGDSRRGFVAAALPRPSRRSSGLSRRPVAELGGCGIAMRGGRTSRNPRRSFFGCKGSVWRSNSDDDIQPVSRGSLKVNPLMLMPRPTNPVPCMFSNAPKV